MTGDVKGEVCLLHLDCFTGWCQNGDDTKEEDEDEDEEDGEEGGDVEEDEEDEDDEEEEERDAQGKLITILEQGKLICRET